MSLQKPKVVYAMRKRQYTVPDREVQVPLVGIHA